MRKSKVKDSLFFYLATKFLSFSLKKYNKKNCFLEGRIGVTKIGMWVPWVKFHRNWINSIGMHRKQAYNHTILYFLIGGRG